MVFIVQYMNIGTYGYGWARKECHNGSNYGSSQHMENYTEQLAPDAVQNQVMYYWCGKSRMFEYQHYLSMTSVIRALRPANIYFIHEVYPRTDKYLYNTWLKELQEEYPFIILDQIRGPRGCSADANASLAVIKSELLRRGGGLYVHENTMITSKVRQLLTRRSVNAMDRTTKTAHGFMMAQIGVIPGSDADDVSCGGHRSNQSAASLYCVDIPDGIHPKDIWESEDTFAQIARWAAYGESTTKRALHDNTNLAPNIVHYTWPFWKGKMDMHYTFYLSILSALYVAHIDTVFIHGVKPTGPYWDKIKNDTRVIVIPRATWTSVYGQSVSVLQHVSDVWRLDVLIRHGGVYCDVDAIFVQPIPVRLRAYDAVLALDWVGPGFRKGDVHPNLIQNGVMLVKPGAPFWLEYQKTMRIFKDNWWVWNSCALPYKVIERHPSYVHLDPHLQINCYHGLCHPIWWPNSTNINVHHLNTNSIPDWRNATYVYHMTGEVPKGLDKEGEEEPNTIFTQMARMILERAGL